MAQKGEIEKELQQLKAVMDTINPNVQILALYKQKKAEHANRVA